MHPVHVPTAPLRSGRGRHRRRRHALGVLGRRRQHDTGDPAAVHHQPRRASDDPRHAALRPRRSSAPRRRPSRTSTPPRQPVTSAPSTRWAASRTPARGGMGVHYIDESLLDATVDLTRPEALPVYEIDGHGAIAGLVAHEYIVPSTPGPRRAHRTSSGSTSTGIPRFHSGSCTRGSGRTTPTGYSPTGTRPSAMPAGVSTSASTCRHDHRATGVRLPQGSALWSPSGATMDRDGPPSCRTDRFRRARSEHFRRDRAPATCDITRPPSLAPRGPSPRSVTSAAGWPKCTQQRRVLGASFSALRYRLRHCLDRSLRGRCSSRPGERSRARVTGRAPSRSAPGGG